MKCSQCNDPAELRITAPGTPEVIAFCIPCAETLGRKLPVLAAAAADAKRLKTRLS